MKIFESTADAAFVTDEVGRVLLWNTAASHLLGYREEDVRGRACCEVLWGVDFAGNPLCTNDCQVLRLLRKGERLRHFQMAVRTNLGMFRWVTACVLAFHEADGELRILHLLWPPELDMDTRTLSGLPILPARSEQPGSAEGSSAANSGRGQLTPREVEVLRKVVTGADNSQISDDLRISVNTVKSHLQSTYRKLGVRRRWAAALSALRHQLI